MISKQMWSVILVALSLAGCVTPADQQAMAMTGLRSWHFLATEDVLGRENWTLDNRAKFMIVSAPADSGLLAQQQDGAQINRHFAEQTYAHFRQWFPNTIFSEAVALTTQQALVQARLQGVNYLIYPQLERWDDEQAPGVGQMLPGAGGIDHVAAVITLMDVVSGRTLQNWELRGQSGLLTAFSDAPSRLVGESLTELAEKLSGHASQNRPWLEWF